MTIAELLLILCFGYFLYFILRPLRRIFENFILRMLGVRHRQYIDATIISEKEHKSTKE